MNQIPRRLIGRVAALLTALGALTSLVAEVMEHGHFPHSWPASLMGIVVGIALWFLPWSRFGNVGTYTFLWLSLAALFIGELTSKEGPHPAAMSLFLVILFAWNGLAHRRWSSLKIAPFAFVVMVGPGLINPAKEVTVHAATLTIPMCVFVGELVAWIASQLVLAQEERKLAALKADFLTAASHEMRTPLTSLIGYADLLSKRTDSLSKEQVAEFSISIRRLADKLEAIVSRLVDLDRSPDAEMDHTDPIGLMSPHYAEGGANSVQKETLVAGTERRSPS